MSIFDCTLDELRRRTSIKWTRWEPDVIPMFVAEMDSRLPEAVTRALTAAIAEGDTGYPEQPIYQEAFADFARWRWGWDADPSAFQLAGDVMQGMRYALEASTRPGEKVVFNPPIYPPFRQIIDGTGRAGVEVPLVGDRLDLDGLERAFADGARAFLLCSPHNPTGAVFTRAELEQVAQIAREHDVTVIADEIHAPFSGAEFTPYLTVDGVDRAFLSTSAAKAFNLAGLKAGLLTASPASSEALRRMPGFVAEAASHLGVIAHAAALEGARDWLLQAEREIVANKELFARLVAEKLPPLDYEPSPGTYLAWLDCTPLGLDHPGRHFHRHARVRFNFGDEFGPGYSQWVRVNLATSPNIIEQAVDRLQVPKNAVNS